jgi:hypothetical protein
MRFAKVHTDAPHSIVAGEVQPAQPRLDPKGSLP